MWHVIAAGTADNLTLPGYGICGLVISGLSVAVLKLYNENVRLNSEALKRERETADSTIPLLVKAVELLSATGPHIDRASSQESEIASTLREVSDFMKDFDRRERRRGT